MLSNIWNDLIHAARSLARARAFTFVCVVSLGIGMAPVIAIPYLSQILTITPRGVNTEGLVLNPQLHLAPHWGLGERPGDLRKFLADRLDVARRDVHRDRGGRPVARAGVRTR